MSNKTLNKTPYRIAWKPNVEAYYGNGTILRIDLTGEKWLTLISLKWYERPIAWWLRMMWHLEQRYPSLNR